jgi:hypothetical protein
MTTREWSESPDPQAMLDCTRDRVTKGTLRPFALTCCSRVLDRVDEEHKREGITRLECLIDGRRVDGDDVGNVRSDTNDAALVAALAVAAWDETTARARAVVAVQSGAFSGSVGPKAQAKAYLEGAFLDQGRFNNERREQADILRRLVNPFAATK